MKCFIGHTNCRYISALLERHFASILNNSGNIVQPYGYVDESGAFQTDARFVRLDAMARAFRLNQKRGDWLEPGLMHPEWGHLNKHLLKMKWKNNRSKGERP